jgi:hypothetical protein
MTWKSGFQLALMLAGIAALALPALSQQPQPDQLFSPPPGQPPSQAEPAEASPPSGAQKAAKSKAAKSKAAPKSDPAPAGEPKAAKSKAAPKSAPAGSLIGTWAGPVSQVAHPKGYNIVVTVRPGGGDTEYPDLNCSGKLTRAAGSGPYVFYTEKITRGRHDDGGRCPDGTFAIALAGDKLAFSWFATVDGQAVFAYSILTRK